MANDNAPRPNSHAQGDFGERLVTYLLPPEWVVHNYKGSEDYGIDLHVEIFTDGRPTGLEFGIQVRVRIHNQNMTTAANAQAERKTFGHRS